MLGRDKKKKRRKYINRKERGGGEGDGIGYGRQEVVKILLMIMKIQKLKYITCNKMLMINSTLVDLLVESPYPVSCWPFCLPLMSCSIKCKTDIVTCPDTKCVRLDFHHLCL